MFRASVSYNMRPCLKTLNQIKPKPANQAKAKTVIDSRINKAILSRRNVKNTVNILSFKCWFVCPVKIFCSVTKGGLEFTM